MILGGVDPSLYRGDITYHKVIDDDFWMVKAENVLVGGKDLGLCKGGCRVIADTGTSLLTAPSNALEIMMNNIEVDDGCLNIKDLPDVTFVIDGIHYDLQP